MGVYQPDGGFVLSERCIVNHVFAALERGREVRAHEAVLDWNCAGRRESRPAADCTRQGRWSSPPALGRAAICLR